MKYFFVLLFAFCLFAQDEQAGPGDLFDKCWDIESDFEQENNPGFIVSLSKNLIGTGRFDLAIGAPVGNKIYYSFYFSTIPGPKVEYVFSNCWVTGLSLRNYKNIYSLRYHFGMKLSRRIMISESFKNGEGAFEITYCF